MSELENARNSERETAPEERAFLSLDDVRVAFEEWGDLDSEVTDLLMLVTYLSPDQKETFFDGDVQRVRENIPEMGLPAEQAEELDSLLAGAEVLLSHHRRVIEEGTLTEVRQILERWPNQIIGKTRHGDKVRLDPATIDADAAYPELLIDTAELAGTERAAVWRYAHEQHRPLPWMNEVK